MAVLTRGRTSTTSAGLLTALVLVLAFGNPAYVDWSRDHADPNTAGGWFLRLLAWPAWNFNSNDSVRDVIARDIKAIVVIVLAALFLSALPGTQLARARGTLSQFFAGWSAYVFAGAFAGFIAAFILSNPTLLAAFQAAGAGAGYGLFTGWIVGIATLGAYRSRP
jgi:hypothetical protein